jgi:hypothetical protein
MQTRKLDIPCPTCGSLEIFYSCTPTCCFNHVCDECRTTFQTGTVVNGLRHAGAVAPSPVPDNTDPAAACAKCESVAVYRMPAPDDTLVCTACGTGLTLELSDIAVG